MAAWHDSGDHEQRSLAEYLGMTETEYRVWTMAPAALPVISRARREGVPLRTLLLPWVTALREANDPKDRPVIHALGHWLAREQPE